MYCLPNVCFLCLNDKDSVNFAILQHTEDEIGQQVKLVLPEIVILEAQLPLLICSTCRQALDDFHNFKKICLDNHCRYNDYRNKLQGPSDSSKQKFDELQVKINENKLLSDIKKKDNIEELESAGSFVENSIYIKEEFSISEESTDPLDQQIINDETESNNEQNCERNINCVDQVTKDKINSSEQEVTKDMCQSTDLKCSVCNELFGEKSHLQNHMMVLHTSMEERKCLICNKMFKQASSLLRHMKVHAGIKDYKCSVCNKTFVILSKLKTHLRVHTGVKDYKCLVCHKMFNQSAHLSSHMTTHTGAKNYKCSICNKMFSQSATLKNHMTTHKATKDYKCSICNKMFSQRAHLKSHMITHTGVKDYKCSICNKSFALKSPLKRHMSTHTSYDHAYKLLGPSDNSKQKFDELQVKINENKLQSDIKKKNNIDSNIEELESAGNFVENTIYIKEEFSISEESTDSKV